MPPETLPGLCFLALAELPTSLLERVVAEVSRHVDVPCRVVPTPNPDELRGTQLDGRPQVDGDELLAKLEAAAEGPELWVGVTSRDIGRRVFRFVFGLAREGAPAVLVSVARLDPEPYGLPPDPALTVRRATAEILHELGHAFGAVHCQRVDCLMHFAPEVESIDLRGFEFCPDCARGLPAELRTVWQDGPRAAPAGS